MPIEALRRIIVKTIQEDKSAMRLDALEDYV